MVGPMDDFFDAALKEGRKKIKALEASEFYLQYVMEWEGDLPHCDHRVLHSPGACGHCDHVPSLQVLRRSLGLKYTDELQMNDALLPGEDRSRASVEFWGGNRRNDV